MASPRASLLGTGMGLEHLVVAVRDLTRATDDFRERLGFAISPGGVHASGTVENSVIFDNDSYFELLGVHDPNRDSANVREMTRFLAVREGPITLGVSVSSAEAAAARLRAAGVEVNGPIATRASDPETGDLSEPFYQNVEVTGDQPYLKETMFFTEKVEGTWEAYVAKNPDAARIQQATVKTHPNSANRIAAVWLAVDDLPRAKATYSSIGLEPRPERILPLLDARVSEVPLGTGSLMLTQSISSRGPVGNLLSLVNQRCAMMGASVEVASLPVARRHVSALAGTSETYANGWFGKSVVAPMESSHGVWVEMFERAAAR